MADWLREGTAARTRLRIDPVRHLLAQDQHGDWRLWCSAGAGRLDNNPHSRKFCRACVALAVEAIAEDTLSPDDVTGWPVRATANLVSSSDGDA